MNLKLETITLSKASTLLSDRLRELIVSGSVKPGETLPSERELVATSGLSRGSVREALKILETEGLVEVRLGRAGGSRVTAPKREGLVRSVETYLRANSIGLRELLDCRIAIEPMLARLCAINRTEQELEKLHALHRDFMETLTDVKRYRSLNFEWHRSIALASRNDPLIALMEAISAPILAASGFERATSPRTRHNAVSAHQEILGAIERRDAEAAAKAMEWHLSAYTGIVDRISSEI